MSRKVADAPSQQMYKTKQPSVRSGRQIIKQMHQHLCCSSVREGMKWPFEASHKTLRFNKGWRRYSLIHKGSGALDGKKDKEQQEAVLQYSRTQRIQKTLLAQGQRLSEVQWSGNIPLHSGAWFGGCLAYGMLQLMAAQSKKSSSTETLP